MTEAAALAGARHLGRGDKDAADGAAVDIMRRVLNTIPMDGVIVIGEGEKDNAPMLFCGERVGDATAPHALAVDVAVDPLDGTSLVAGGRSGAVAVIAVAERGAMFDPGPVMYMDKLAVGPLVNPHRVSLSYPVAQNLAAVAEALSKPVSEVTVCILDRPRHAELIRQVRATGARIRLISDGDVAAAIETARPGSPVDVMLGIGGTPEGVVAAAALKCLGGSIQGRLAPREEFGERERALALGYDLSRILFTDDLCGGDDVFFAATGVSDGDLLRGVRFEGGGRGRTQSIVMRAASGTVRTIETEHRWGQARAGRREAVTAPTATGVEDDDDEARRERQRQQRSKVGMH